MSYLGCNVEVVIAGYDLHLVTHHLVTHHPAAARNADATLVLDQGQLVGLGSHVTLLRECNPYAALWSDYARSLEGELDRADLSDKRETT